MELEKILDDMSPEELEPRLELQILADATHRVAGEIIRKAGVKLEYLVGTMIELPRAALMAGELALAAEFFSFGTNDLTQTTLAASYSTIWTKSVQASSRRILFKRSIAQVSACSSNGPSLVAARLVRN